MGAAILIAGILVGGFWFVDLGSKKVVIVAKTDLDTNLGASIQNESEEKYRVEEYMVEEGDTWEAIIRKLGVGWELGLSLLDASEDTHNLASIRAGNELRFLFDAETEELQSVEYDIDDENFLSLTKDEEDEFVGEEKEIVYKIVQVVKSGTIESSLYETAQQKGVPPGVILNLAWIFSWDIDFASSIQAGDSFSVVYEERYRDGEKVKAGNILAARFVNSGNEFYSFFYINPEEYESYYDTDGRELRRQFLRSPLDYKRITSGFSYNRFHPILNTFTTHRAIDYAAALGTSVSATAGGKITYVGWKGGNGKYVRIKHANGYSTGYAHLSLYAKGIKIGARVKQNQVIGFVGSTGLSTGPHLHYEMLKNGVFINPLRLDLPPGDMMKKEYLDEFSTKRDHFLKLLEN